MTPSPLVFAGLAFFALLLAAPVAARLLCRAFGLRRPTVSGGRPVYTAVGLTPLLVAAVTYGALWQSGATLGMTHAPVFLLVALACGLPGLGEDIAGEKRRAMTALATVSGVAAGLGASFLLHRPHLLSLDFVLDAALIALGPLALWALNTRPGVALAGFLALLAVPAFTATALAVRFARLTAATPLPDDLLWSTPPSTLLGPVLLAAALEGWPEARGTAAFGSVGVRLLGGVGGLAAALALPLWGKFVLLAALVCLTLAGRARLEAGLKRLR